MSQAAEKLLQTRPLSVKLAGNPEEIEQALRLRYKVFVEESGNLKLSRPDGIERDAYDACCDHLIVTDLESNEIVGTYRLLPGPRAIRHLGFYSETEFDLTEFRESKRHTLELGRSCVAAGYRDGRAIQLLWEGIAGYIAQHGYRYLIGCASLRLNDRKELNELYSMLKAKGVVTDRFGIRPLDTHRIPDLQVTETKPDEKTVFRKLPPLMKGYQWLGAEIAGEPAYDPVFETTDFLVVLDTDNVTRRYRRHFLNR